MLKKTRLTLTLLLLLMPALANSAQDSNSKFAEFKNELLPQVGKTVTVEGVLRSAKLGWIVEFKGWGIYVYATRESEASKMNALNRFNEKPVSVTGTLRYFPKPKVPAGNVIEAIPPEHFYFDVAEAKVVAASTQESVVIKETVSKPVKVSTAPAECLATFREFFQYVQRTKPSIVTDETGQRRWLSKNLLEALKQKVATFKDQPNDPDFPGNGTFVGTWDNPSTFTIVGSRRYNKRAVIDVWYAWGKGTNYPGDTRLSYFVFLYEDGAWKLDDVYTFRGEFVTAESLTQYLSSK